MVWILLLSIGLIILASAVWKIHPFPVLIGVSIFFGLSSGLGYEAIVGGIAAGFGNTLRGIGMLIIAGTILGAFMEQRGALRTLAEKVLRVTGKKRVPLAMGIIGYIASIAIFCDSAFVILIGLCREMSKLAKVSLAVGATALSMGLFASHCLIPPTPGPLAAATLLQADIGLVMGVGAVLALAATGAGWLWGCRFGRDEIVEPNLTETAELPVRYAGRWYLAALPIVLPLVLILGGSVVFYCGDAVPAWGMKLAKTLGNPFTALTLGALIAVFGLGRCRLAELGGDGLVGKAILQASNILIITGAGGAFGEVLRLAEIGRILPNTLGDWSFGVILLPVLVSAVLKTAQGSSTVAIMACAGIMAPLLDNLGLDTPFLRALTVSAICCGAVMVSHTNDSFFWIVTQFSGFSVRQGLKLQTLGSLVAGLAATLLLWLGFVVVKFFEIGRS